MWMSFFVFSSASSNLENNLTISLQRLKVKISKGLKIMIFPLNGKYYKEVICTILF